MNVQQRRTTVIQMLTVPIAEDRLTVHVEGGMKEMVLIVKVGTDLATTVRYSSFRQFYVNYFR